MYEKQLIEHVPRNKGYITALGTAASGHFEVKIGPNCGDEAYHEYADKRVTKAEELSLKAGALLEASTGGDAKMTIWRMLQEGMSRQLDYDTRLCPARALSNQMDRLEKTVGKTVEKLIGQKVDDAARSIEGLPGQFGGMSLSPADEQHANVAFATAHVGIDVTTRRTAAKLGCDMEDENPDDILAKDAFRKIEEECGVVLDEAGVHYNDEARAVYERSRSAEEYTSEELFNFYAETDDIPALRSTPFGKLEAAGEPNEAEDTDEGKAQGAKRHEHLQVLALGQVSREPKQAETRQWHGRTQKAEHGGADQGQDGGAYKPDSARSSAWPLPLHFGRRCRMTAGRGFSLAVVQETAVSGLVMGWTTQK